MSGWRGDDNQFGDGDGFYWEVDGGRRAPVAVVWLPSTVTVLSLGWLGQTLHTTVHNCNTLYSTSLGPLLHYAALCSTVLYSVQCTVYSAVQ